MFNQKEYGKEYREKNKEALSLQKKLYWQKNKKRLNARSAQYRAANRDTINTKKRATVKELRAFVNSFKANPCLDCGNSYPPYVLDFDHVRGVKEFEIGTMRHFNKESLLKEIAKCDLVCSNCHRERTFSRIRNKKRLDID